jgi:hypothetical protein
MNQQPDILGFNNAHSDQRKQDVTCAADTNATACTPALPFEAEVSFHEQIRCDSPPLTSGIWSAASDYYIGLRSWENFCADVNLVESLGTACFENAELWKG